MAFTSGQVVNAADLNDLDITTLTTSGTVTIGGFSLPAVDGTADQVLVTNGSGTVTWQDAAGGGGTPGGSDGQIQYNNGGAFGGASALYYDDVNSRVGIGTTSPSSILDLSSTSTTLSISDSDGTVGGSMSAMIQYKDSSGAVQGQVGYGTGVGFMVVDNNDGPMRVGTASADSLYLRTNAANRISIDSSGNVGIGDDTPSYKLDVNGEGRFTGNFRVDGGSLNLEGTNTTNPNSLNFHSPNDSTFWHLSAPRESESDSFKIYYYNGSSYTLNTTLNTNGSVTFASTLYAGTGTSSIDVLQIRNEIQASNGSASDPSYTFSSDGDTGMYRQTTNSIGFATGGVQHYWNANGIYLANGDWFRTTGNSGWFSQSYSGGIYMIDTTWVRVYNSKAFYVGSGNLRSDGQVIFPNISTTTTYNTLRWKTDGQILRYSSTADIKDDVVSITPIMEYLNERSLIYDLRPVLFHEKDQLDGTNSTRGEYIPGLIAEEVLEVAPEMCFYDENGNLISYGNDHLIPHLIAEIQRMMPMVEELYGTTHPDWVAPTPRPVERASSERQRFDEAAAAQALVGRHDISDPLDGQQHLEDETND